MEAGDGAKVSGTESFNRAKINSSKRKPIIPDEYLSNDF